MNRDDDETTLETSSRRSVDPKSNVLLDDNIEVASTAPQPQPQRPRSVRFLTEEEDHVGPSTASTTTERTTTTRVHQRCNSNDDNTLDRTRTRRRHALTERSASLARLVPLDEREARSNWTKLRHHVRRRSSSLLRLSASSDTTTAAATTVAVATAASSCRSALHSSSSMDTTTSPSETAAPHYRIVAHRRRISGVPVVASSAVVVHPEDTDEPQGAGCTSSVRVAALPCTLQPNLSVASSSASVHSWQWRRRREWWQPQHWSKTCQNAVADYLLWCFQTHFGIVTLVSYVQWLVWVTFFAIWIYIVGHVQPQCLAVLDAGDFEEAGAYGHCVSV